MSELTQSPAWRALQAHHAGFARTLRQLFDADGERAQRYRLEAAGLTLDYSKNHLDARTLQLLLALAAQQHVPAWIARMFGGDKINNTEQRAVLHVALRNRAATPIYVEGADVMPGVNAVLAKMQRFTQSVHSGAWRGYSGERITDVVNIGIGGSDLGPAMVCGALKHLARLGVRSHFVSNIDSAHLLETLAELDWQRTLFVVASKTFSTEETLTNAHSARRWLVEHAANEAAVRAHFVAVSTNRELVTKFGIDAENMFEFWDWVGGRYSLWSAIGLPIALAIGMPQFERLLEGAHAMDEHFRSAPPEANMPLMLALIGVWYRNFWGSGNHAILPYSQSLARFPAFLQQLEMESNGKRVDRNGAALDYASAPVVWGEPGTNGQHAFYQLIHQGTELVPVDFILALEAAYPLGDHHPRLAANCLAQAEALMCGKSAQEACEELLRLGQHQEDAERLAPHRTFIGDKPSNLILLPRLDAHALGALIALYEHKVFVQGVIWNINSFDQWGVELGKVLAKTIFSEIYGNIGPQPHDPSTAAWVRRLRG